MERNELLQINRSLTQNHDEPRSCRIEPPIGFQENLSKYHSELFVNMRCVEQIRENGVERKTSRIYRR
jgi:hypothetical protein